MIKAVLLDADGVILLPRKRYFSDILAEDFKIPLKFILPLFKNEFQDCLVGKADLKEVLTKKYLKKWGWKGSVEELLTYWWKSEGDVNKPVLSLISTLRKKGIRSYLASDQEKNRANHLLNTLGLKKFLDGAFFSCNMGLRKSDKAFFVKILEDLNLKPNEVLFWDDEEENIAVARQARIDARLFTVNSPQDFSAEI